MSQTKVQNVPFSWENKPGISKAAPRQERIEPEVQNKLQLPPPPPSPYHMNSPKKGLSNNLDDPFLAAYMECTKSYAKKSKGKASGRKKKGGFAVFSCKNSSKFVEDAVVRMSELPDAEERETRRHAKLSLGNSKGFN